MIGCTNQCCVILYTYITYIVSHSILHGWINRMNDLLLSNSRHLFKSSAISMTQIVSRKQQVCHAAPPALSSCAPRHHKSFAAGSTASKFFWHFCEIPSHSSTPVWSERKKSRAAYLRCIILESSTTVDENCNDLWVQNPRPHPYTSDYNSTIKRCWRITTQIWVGRHHILHS